MSTPTILPKSRLHLVATDDGRLLARSAPLAAEHRAFLDGEAADGCTNPFMLTWSLKHRFGLTDAEAHDAVAAWRQEQELPALTLAEAAIAMCAAARVDLAAVRS